MHDPLTLASVIAPHYVQFKTRKVDMDEKGIMRPRDYGQDTVVSVSADYSSFWKMFEERILK